MYERKIPKTPLALPLIKEDARKYFLSHSPASLLEYPKGGDDSGVKKQLLIDSCEMLKASIHASSFNKVTELTIYPNILPCDLTLEFSFDENQDFLSLYIRHLYAWDKDEEHPLKDQYVFFDPNSPKKSLVQLTLPQEETIILICVPENLNMRHGKNTVTIKRVI